MTSVTSCFGATARQTPLPSSPSTLSSTRSQPTCTTVWPKRTRATGRKTSRSRTTASPLNSTPGTGTRAIGSQRSTVTEHEVVMRRRDFLSSIALAPGLAAVRPTQAATAPASSHRLKLGTVTYNIAKDWDVPTIIRNLTEAGFDAVELRTTHKHGVEPTLSRADRAAVRKQFEASPVKIGGLGTTCEFHSPDPAVVRENIDEAKAWIELAADVGSPSIKVRPNGIPKNVPEEKTLEQIGKSLAECGAFARDHGIVVQLEVHGEESERVPRIRKMFDYGGNHPNVRACWNS